ncbi:MAG: hypothetical protein ACOWWR_13580 [Eubacteriales bacterium]
MARKNVSMGVAIDAETRELANELKKAGINLSALVRIAIKEKHKELCERKNG